MTELERLLWQIATGALSGDAVNQAMRQQQMMDNMKRAQSGWGPGPKDFQGFTNNPSQPPSLIKGSPPDTTKFRKFCRTITAKYGRL